MRWDKWLQGLIAAFLTGVSTGFTAYVVDPKVFNLNDLEGIKRIGLMTLVSGLINFFTYLKQHPIPETYETKLQGP